MSEYELAKYGLTQEQVSTLLDAIQKEFPDNSDMFAILGIDDEDFVDIDDFDIPEPSWETRSYNWHGEPDSHGRV